MGEPEYHTSNKMPKIRLADSRGIELSNYGVKEVTESINRFINKQLESQHSDLFVHYIWYCCIGNKGLKNELEITEGEKGNKEICDDLNNFYYEGKFLSDESGNIIMKFSNDFINNSFVQFNQISDSSIPDIGKNDGFYNYVANLMRDSNLQEEDIGEIISDFVQKKREFTR